MNIPILYEDNHLLVVEKPVNMPVQSDSSKDLDLLTSLKDFIKVRDEKPGNVYLALVHRLDRPVGGAIVFAKTSKAASRLANELRQRKIQRTYLAITRGIPQEGSGQLTDYLAKNHQKNISYVSKKSDKNAKIARLNYSVLERAAEEKLALLRVQLETGRSHQIRVQLANINTPLYGDQKYGQNVNKPGQQIALWAHELSFKHPTKDEIVTVISQPPSEYPWDLFGY